jgi:hypothetical protein
LNDYSSPDIARLTRKRQRYPQHFDSIFASLDVCERTENSFQHNFHKLLIATNVIVQLSPFNWTQYFQTLGLLWTDGSQTPWGGMQHDGFFSGWA